MKYNILITSTSFQDSSGKHHDLLKSQDWHVDYLRGPLSEEDVLLNIDKYDAVICGDDNYTKKVLEKGKKNKLKILSKYGVGLDKIDLAAAKNLEIKVFNCPGINQVSVAEHVLALLFSFEKNIHLQYSSVQSFSWSRKVGREINGKTIGIIGMGYVGKELSLKANALGLKVLAFDILKDESFYKLHKEISYVNSLDDIYAESDIISLHIPHNSQTHNIINMDIINNKILKKPVIINTARGLLVNDDSIIHGLKKNLIRGYLCDVLAQEPIEINEKLVGIENVMITPHTASRTFENIEKQGLKALNNLIENIE